MEAERDDRTVVSARPYYSIFRVTLPGQAWPGSPARQLRPRSQLLDGLEPDVAVWRHMRTRRTDARCRDDSFQGAANSPRAERNFQRLYPSGHPLAPCREGNSLRTSLEARRLLRERRKAGLIARSISDCCRIAA